MTFLRHAPRHVHASVVAYATEQLTALGWIANIAVAVPFGLDPVTIIDTRPFVGSALDNQIGPGVITISLGNELTAREEELGGPLTRQEYPIFCDVFMTRDSEALALATDLRDAFLGRHSTSKRSIHVVDQVTSTDVSDWILEFEDVQRIAPEHNFPLAWHSVQVTARCFFPEEVF